MSDVSRAHHETDLESHDALVDIHRMDEYYLGLAPTLERESTCFSTFPLEFGQPTETDLFVLLVLTKGFDFHPTNHESSSELAEENEKEATTK